MNDSGLLLNPHHCPTILFFRDRGETASSSLLKLWQGAMEEAGDTHPLLWVPWSLSQLWQIAHLSRVTSETRYESVILNEKVLKMRGFLQRREEKARVTKARTPGDRRLGLYGTLTGQTLGKALDLLGETTFRGSAHTQPGPLEGSARLLHWPSLRRAASHVYLSGWGEATPTIGTLLLGTFREFQFEFLILMLRSLKPHPLPPNPGPVV